MNDKIKCPNCGHHFEIEEALTGQLEEQIKERYEQKINEQAQRFQAEKIGLEKEREQFEAQKNRENELFKQRLEQKVNEEKSRLEKTAYEKFEAQLKSLQEENEEKKIENKELRKKEVELLKKEQFIKEQQEEMELQAEKLMLEKQGEIEEKAKEKMREEFQLKEMEYRKKIEDAQKSAEEFKRKVEQGSMQLQGEVQELALEELLVRSYPFDRIEEVPKGVTGADVIQTVVDASLQVCGKIVYESKRTKHFAGDWIDKLKQDQITCKADVAVIVTETLPKELDRFGEKDGVWICTFSEVKSVSFVLRQMLIRMQSIRESQENKGDKMELLYSYLTSNEFVQNVNRIVENYDNMHLQLTREKRAMAKLWAEREKQIEGVQENISSLFGSIKGIAGNSLPNAAQLELGSGDEEI